MKKYNKKLRSYYFGISAEYLVIIFLLFKGYKILKRRHKTYCGEIDLITIKKDTLVIIEVKARKKIQTVEEVLSTYQQNRITQGTMAFIAKNKKYQNLGIRFDLIIVQSFKITHHLKGYWD